MTSGAAVERVIAGRGDDPASTVDPSAAALAANARLEELRRAAGVVTRPAGVGLDQGQAADLPARPSPADRGQKALEARRRELGINYRPPVATVEGAAWSAWAADQVAAGLDKGGAGDVCAQTIDPLAGAGGLLLDAAASTLEDNPAGAGLDQLAGVVATVYPSLAAAFMASKHLAPVGRLWLLLRSWDSAGQGCYTLDQVYRAFSVEGSAWHVADRRQVQRLIKAGAGTFWTLRDYHGGRYHGLQMTGPAGVAAALGLDRLAGRPVTVPVADLLGGMHSTNAALFAVVVTLRRPRRRGAGLRPVTRRTLAGMTGRAASTQRTYSKTARIEAQTNYVILPLSLIHI